jgi:hypothetical protein
MGDDTYLIEDDNLKILEAIIKNGLPKKNRSSYVLKIKQALLNAKKSINASNKSFKNYEINKFLKDWDTREFKVKKYMKNLDILVSFLVRGNYSDTRTY